MRRSRVLGLLALAVFVSSPLGASGAAPKRQLAPAGETIVVHPRSFTDSGVVVPVGSQNFYVQEMTTFFRQPYEIYSPGVLWRPDPFLTPRW